jgi:plastocyanin
MLLGLVAVLALAIGAHAQAAATVQITRTGFVPKSVTVKDGDTVTWRNADTVEHQVVADNGSFASAVLKPGATYSFTFKRGGRFPYHDALHPKLRGVVTVSGPPPSLTLGADLPIVTYGTQVTLSGVVSNKRAGESVTILGEPYPQTSFAQVAIVQTTTGGAFTYVVTPELLSTYEAQWKGATSGTVILQVAPKITFRPGPSRYWRTQVSAGTHSFAGRYVYLQRYSALGQWVSIEKLKLGQLSGRVFRYTPPRGLSHIRIFMTVNQAGAGYLAAHSGSQPVRRR